MELNELIVTGAAIALQLITIWLWRTARADADTYRAMFFAAYDQLTELHRNSIRRDPRTGRYLPVKGKVIEL